MRQLPVKSCGGLQKCIPAFNVAHIYVLANVQNEEQEILDVRMPVLEPAAGCEKLS